MTRISPSVRILAARGRPALPGVCVCHSSVGGTALYYHVEVRRSWTPKKETKPTAPSSMPCVPLSGLGATEKLLDNVVVTEKGEEGGGD